MRIERAGGGEGERRDGSAAGAALPLRRVLATRASFPDHYAWLLLVGVLDVMLTTVVLGRLGGVELNPIARWAIAHADTWGLILLKLLAIVVFVAICEVVAAHRPEVGRRLASWAIALSAVPVVVGLGLATMHAGLM